jgi:hypothetical protein
MSKNPYQEPPVSNELNRQPQHFILRLWPEILADDSVEWRGKLHHVQTNEIRYFRDWPALLPTLLAIMRQANLPVSVPNLYPSTGQGPDSEPGAEPPVK